MGELPKNFVGSGDTYRPRTALGARLIQIRKEIVASGEPLLSWDALKRELAERRGDVATDN